MSISTKNTFVPHEDLSSQVDLDVELGVISKMRSGRSVNNLLNEARALRVWEKLLGEFNIAAPAIAGTTSPRLVSVDTDTRTLNMTFCPGVTIGRATIGDHSFRHESLPRNEVREDITFRVGALAGLKSVEGLVHGDYRQRHLLYDPLVVQSDSNRPRLSVIDVESSKLAASDEVAEEDAKLHRWLMLAVPTRQKDSTREAYLDGFSTGRSHAPGTIADIVREARREIN